MRIRSSKDYILCEDTIIAYLGSEKEVTVPAELDGIKIKKIGAGAFMGCRSLETVRLEQGIGSVGEKAFSECGNLREADLPDTAVCIRESVFEGSENLERIRFSMPVSTDLFRILKKSGIPLMDGRILLDPMIFGEKEGKKIMGFIPETMKGGYRVTPDMGCIYECLQLTGSTESRPLFFAGHSPDPKEDLWLEHDEEYDDRKNPRRLKSYFGKTGMLFFLNDERISDGEIRIRLELYTGRYCYVGKEKVITDGEVFLFDREAYFRSDRIRPFAYDACLKTRNRSEKAKEARRKYDFISSIL